ncbi:MAG: Smr/MutS family protein [Candidatus Aminicenantes bacterium]
MENINLPFIQVAGIRDWKEAKILMQAGVEYLGFPVNPPVHDEELSEPETAEVIRRIPAPHRPVVITYSDSAEEIIRLCENTGARIAQIHGDISWNALSQIKNLTPRLSLLKSLIVQPGSQPRLQEEISLFSDWVEAFITDTYDPRTGATGATGKIHDWEVSRELVVRSPRPVILAGGLNPDNVEEAIRRVRPEGVDAHTGLEDSKGRKDPKKVRRFLQAARAAFADIHLPNTSKGGMETPAHSDAVEVPIDGVLDLHAFPPREVKDLVPEYLRECRQRGIYHVRIIHGKGTGTLCRIVQSILDKNPDVIQYKTADSTGGGWGATELTLRKK